MSELVHSSSEPATQTRDFQTEYEAELARVYGRFDPRVHQPHSFSILVGLHMEAWYDKNIRNGGFYAKKT